MEKKKHNASRGGDFVRAELATGKKTLAAAFYGELFGWRAAPAEGFGEGVGGAYDHLLGANGQTLGGWYELPSRAVGQKVPSHWVFAVALDPDIEGGEGGLADALLRVEGAGGSVVQPPFEIVGEGRVALVQDPTGAILQLFEPDAARQSKTPSGADLGEFTWHELATRSFHDAARFYRAVFHWDTSEDFVAGGNRAGMRYAGFVKNGRPVGSLLELGEEFRRVPSHWMGYVHVEDVYKASVQAVAIGAKVLMKGATVDGIGTFAVLNDPAGAPFGIFTPIMLN